MVRPAARRLALALVLLPAALLASGQGEGQEQMPPKRAASGHGSRGGKERFFKGRMNLFKDRMMQATTIANRSSRGSVRGAPAPEWSHRPHKPPTTSGKRAWKVWRRAKEEASRARWSRLGAVGCPAETPGMVLPWAKSEALVLEPQMSPSRTHNRTLDPFQRSAQRRCAMIVDRHVHKNGGSTIRDLFLENERLGYGIYQGYTQMHWDSDVQLLQSIAKQAVSNGNTPNHLLMLEAHFGHTELNGKMLNDLKSLEQLYTGAGLECPLVLMTRIREPLEYYLSFYRWGVGFRQEKDPDKFGRGFLDWARKVPELQSSIILRGMTAMPAEYMGTLSPQQSSRDLPETWTELEKFLDQFSVVGTVNRFDEALLMAADLSGLPLTLYKRNTPHNKGGFKAKNYKLCPDMEACRKVIREIAPRDYLMWEKYSARFEDRVRAAGPAFAARVRQYKAAVKEAQDAWQRAPRKQTICRFHPETSTRLTELELANLRCPVVDSPELCQRLYAHRLFECPWQYQPNSSLTDPLGCWRPSMGFARRG